jgi:hypothetical protein
VYIICGDIFIFSENYLKIKIHILFGHYRRHSRSPPAIYQDDHELPLRALFAASGSINISSIPGVAPPAIGVAVLKFWTGCCIIPPPIPPPYRHHSWTLMDPEQGEAEARHIAEIFAGLRLFGLTTAY